MIMLMLIYIYDYCKPIPLVIENTLVDSPAGPSGKERGGGRKLLRRSSPEEVCNERLVHAVGVATKAKLDVN